MSIQRNILALSLSCIALSACGGSGFFTPTSVTQRKIEVVESTFENSYDLKTLSAGMLGEIANNYIRYGVDQLQLTVSYDPNTSGGFSASDAMGKASEISKTLREGHGLKNIKVSLLPVKNQDPQLFVNYMQQEAVAPEGCPDIPGIIGEGANTEEANENYEFGCGIKSVMVKQVYRQKDLIGTSGRDEDYNGRRTINNLYGTGYYDGQPNQPINGESSSEEN